MNKKLAAIFSVVIILTFIGYIIYDAITGRSESLQSTEPVARAVNEDKWTVSREITASEGQLLSIAVDGAGRLYMGGESYVTCLDKNFAKLWSLKTMAKITALSIAGDTVFAASDENIDLISTNGELIDEWGPYEANSIITSISANKEFVVFADAGVKRVFVLKKNGEVSSMMGQSENKFIIPSPYFDVAISDDNTIFVANTGNRRVETWSKDGALIEFYGEPGTAPGSFCGCCNPAHFTIVPQGFVTAEKGINRIKILDPDGGFTEFVSSNNHFTASVPLDLASADGITIYAADRVDSKIYVFTRK
ncbi:MAG: hypothetical protein WAL29_09330 [Bacteroidales bacterium]